MGTGRNLEEQNVFCLLDNFVVLYVRRVKLQDVWLLKDQIIQPLEFDILRFSFLKIIFGSDILTSDKFSAKKIIKLKQSVAMILTTFISKVMMWQQKLFAEDIMVKNAVINEFHHYHYHDNKFP